MFVSVFAVCMMYTYVSSTVSIQILTDTFSITACLKLISESTVYSQLQTDVPQAII